jgi:hypothetical protein
VMLTLFYFNEKIEFCILFVLLVFLSHRIRDLRFVQLQFTSSCVSFEIFLLPVSFSWFCVVRHLHTVSCCSFSTQNFFGVASARSFV